MIRGQKIYLDTVREEDLPLMLDWINDREQTSHSAPYHPVSLEEHLNWFHNFIKRSDCYLFAIRSVTNDTLIGSCQLRAVHPIHRTAELQIRIGVVEERGQGQGTEAIQLLCAFGFQNLNLNRLFLQLFARNTRAYHCYLRAGFQKEGVLRAAAFINGEYLDMVVMGILKDEFAALPKMTLSQQEASV